MKSLGKLLGTFGRVTGFTGVAFAALAAALVAGPASADTAVLTRNGVLYEVVVCKFADVQPSAAGTPDGRTPVVALRTTRPGVPPALELVTGSISPDDKVWPSLDYDETTDTVLVLYMQLRGILYDMHFAARRSNSWSEQVILNSAGFNVEINPQLVATRQKYFDMDWSTGQLLRKSRTIVSIVWWEEGATAQARYAPVFLEDGRLHLDSITAYNLNELAGAAGPTDTRGLPFSAYQYPTVQRDPLTNGSVLASFANLATRRQIVLRIAFSDDIREALADGVPPGREANARIHTPIGRNATDGALPMLVPSDASLSTVIAPVSLVSTFFWSDQAALHVLRDDAPEGTPDTSIVLRPDFSLDRAIGVVRDMALSQ